LKHGLNFQMESHRQKNFLKRIAAPTKKTGRPSNDPSHRTRRGGVSYYCYLHGWGSSEYSCPSCRPWPATSTSIDLHGTHFDDCGCLSAKYKKEIEARTKELHEKEAIREKSELQVEMLKKEIQSLKESLEGCRLTMKGMLEASGKKRK
jgi:hypothetical protein